MRRRADRAIPGAELLLGKRWAIYPDALRALGAAAEKTLPTPEAIAAAYGRPLEATFSVSVRDGIATVPIQGPLCRQWDFWAWLFGASCYEMIARDFSAALADPEVDAIILDVDSPGGEVDGVDELAQLIYAGRGVKPIVAHVGGMAASAAYWLSVAADEVVATDTGILGSIGTLISFWDTTELEKDLGVRRIEMVSSQTPKKAMDPTSREGQSQIQSLLDALADVFIDRVAEYRGTDRDVVLSDFGQGGVFVGAGAVEAGLADRLATFEALHAELAGTGGDSASLYSPMQEMPMASQRMTARAPAGAKPRAEAATADKEGDQQEILDEQQKEADPCEPATADALAAKYPTFVAAWRAEGATAERERVAGIQALAMAGHEAVIAACVADPTCTPAQAAVKLVTALQAKGGTPSNPAAAQHLANLAAEESLLDTPSGASEQEDGGDAAMIRSIISLHDTHSPRRRAAGRG